MKVDRATPDDFPAMIEMGRAMHEESEFRFLPFDPEKLAALGKRYIDDAHKLLLICRDANGKPCGMFAGYVDEYYFCRDRLACELFWYVVTEKRGTSAAIRMLKEFDVWARGQGVRELAVSIWTGVSTDKFASMLERIGFKFEGSNFKMRIG